MLIESAERIPWPAHDESKAMCSASRSLSPLRRHGHQSLLRGRSVSSGGSRINHVVHRIIHFRTVHRLACTECFPRHAGGDSAANGHPRWEDLCTLRDRRCRPACRCRQTSGSTAPEAFCRRLRLIALIITPMLLVTYSPRSLVFRQFQSKFEALLDRAPPAGNYAVTPLNADVEPFWIDQWGTDHRGGIFFRTQYGLNDSFGFAYRPNTEGSPFGDARYELHHLTGDWYSFAASDER